MSDMTRGSLTGATVRRANEEANHQTNTKARANQAGADHLAGAA
jgi:hypothetical protein